MRILPTIAVLLCTLIVSARAQSTFIANLDGLQVVPPNASPAFGTGDFTLTGTNLVVTTGFYQSLLGGSSILSTLSDGAIGVNGAQRWLFSPSTHLAPPPAPSAAPMALPPLKSRTFKPATCTSLSGPTYFPVVKSAASSWPIPCPNPPPSPCSASVPLRSWPPAVIKPD